jgi:hypothetical protein
MAWTKVLPPHFLAAREAALIRAHQYEEENGIISSPPLSQQHSQQYNPMMQHPPTYMDGDPAFYPDNHHPPYDNVTNNNMMGYGSGGATGARPQPGHHSYAQQSPAKNAYGQPSYPLYGATQPHQYGPQSTDISGPNTFSGPQYNTSHTIDSSMYSPNRMHHNTLDQNHLRNVAEEGAFMDGTVPIDEAIATTHGGVGGRYHFPRPTMGMTGGIDPPEDEPPSLRKRGGMVYHHGGTGGSQLSVSSADPSMNSPSQYEPSPPQQHNGDDDEPISPAFEPSPSEFDVDPDHDDEAIRYNNNEMFHDDSNPYYQNTGNNTRFQIMEGQRQRYDPRYDNEEQVDYERSPDYAPDETFQDRGSYQYDHHTANYGSNKYNEGESDQASPQYHPNAELDNNPVNGYPPRDGFDNGENIDQYDDITPQPSGVPFSDPGDDIDYDGNGFPLEKVTAMSPQSESEYSAPTMNDDGFSNGLLYMSTSTDENIDAPLETTRRGNVSSQQPTSSSEVHHFPPVSPRSGHGSEFSQSSAMRGAQELLRRNRQKRLELAMRMKQQVRQYQEQDDTNDATTDENQQRGDVNYMLNTNEVISPQSQDSNSTWQTGASEYTGSEVTGGSSIWTETENNPDRSSRRALILQMARARMKNQGGGGGNHKPTSNHNDSSMNLNTTLEEKKLEHIQESSEGADYAVDLD